MVKTILISTAALVGVAAIAALVRRQMKRRAEARREEHFAVLRSTLNPSGKPTSRSDKPADGVSGTGGNAGAQNVVQPDAGKDKSAPSSPGTALMRLPHPDGLTVNGGWYYTMIHTVEPDPIHISRAALRQALERARSRYNAAYSLYRQHRAEEAEEKCLAALDEVNANLRRDHWYAAEVLNLYGCIQFDKGFYAPARETWEQAEQICEEWPRQSSHLLPTIRDNLKRVRGMLGF